MTDPPVPPPPLPPDAYRQMARLLRSGLLLAGVILAVALGVFVYRHSGESLPHILEANPIAGFLTLSGLVAGLGGGHSQAYLTVGIIVLVATPLARVAMGAYYFERAGDRALGRIAIIVLILLLAGILVLGPFLAGS